MPSLFSWRVKTPFVLGMGAPSNDELTLAFRDFDELSNGSAGKVSIPQISRILRSFGFVPTELEFDRATHAFGDSGVTQTDFLEICGKLYGSGAWKRQWAAQKREMYQKACTSASDDSGLLSVASMRAILREGLRAGQKDEAAVEHEIDEIIRGCITTEGGDISDEGTIDFSKILTGVFGAVGLPGYEDKNDAQRDAPDMTEYDLADLRTYLQSIQQEQQPAEGGTAGSAHDAKQDDGVQKVNMRDLMTQEQKKALAYKSRLTAFFAKHDKEKIGEVDARLSKYKGKEEAMFRFLVAKYGPE